MTTRANPYLIENKRSFEMIQELKSEVLGFEEFLKNYQSHEMVIASYEK
ncbi:MAG: hypothetical protein GBAus27B_000491 [Mycoplasmataceae bacterium]|nr:MAG: hypothetical protein GBAus27B_000491 [Mycoplasmataceae bacterium]